MAALTAASWTTTITSKTIAGKRKIVRGTLLLAGTDTYPTGGIPLPAIGVLGMARFLDTLILTAKSAATTSYLWYYDKTNHKVQEYDTGSGTGVIFPESANTDVPGPITFQFQAEGW